MQNYLHHERGMRYNQEWLQNDCGLAKRLLKLRNRELRDIFQAPAKVHASVFVTFHSSVYHICNATVRFARLP